MKTVEKEQKADTNKMELYHYLRQTREQVDRTIHLLDQDHIKDKLVDIKMFDTYQTLLTLENQIVKYLLIKDIQKK